MFLRFVSFLCFLCFLLKMYVFRILNRVIHWLLLGFKKFCKGFWVV